MKYNQPLDQPSTPDAPYVDGVPASGIQGSIVPAASIEFDQREVVEVIFRAWSRGYSDFTNTPCASPANADLMQLRKAIEGFIRSSPPPVFPSDLIDSFLTFTVHGAGADFTDLQAALEYLSKFKITQHGKVTLRIAAGQWSYSSTIFFDHPNNNRIFVLGASMLGSVPTNFTGYTLTGSAPANRSSDTTANLAMLRTKFATELRVPTIEITGRNLGAFDAILVTPFGTATNGIMITAASTQEDQAYLLTDYPRPANGVAVVGFSSGILIVCAGNSTAFGLGFPIVTIGNISHGVTVLGHSCFQPEGICMSFSNGNAGFCATHHSWLHFDVTNCQALYNAGSGILLYQSAASGSYAVVFGNADRAFNLDESNATFDNLTLSNAGVYNLAGDGVASHNSQIVVASMVGHRSLFSPTLNTTGNSNSLITTT